MGTWFKRFAAVALFAVLTGCANLSAIQEFGKLSADAASYTKLTQEYASSPTRSKQYTLASEEDKRKALDALAETRKAQVASLQLYHSTLFEYMTAISDLASDEVVSFDDELGGLADAALKQKYIKESEAKAVKSLGTILASAATDFYRQRKLKEVIGQADAPLQTVIGAMHTIVVGGYASSLENEKAYARSYYRNLEARARNDDKQTVLAERLYGERIAKEAELDGRITASEQYGNVLKAIGSAHHKLFEQRDKVSDAEVQRQLKQYVKKIWAGYKAVQAEDSEKSSK
jgi:hypothetical protein